MPGVFSRVVNRLYAALDESTRRRPIATKVSIGAVLGGLGDGIVQKIERSKAPRAGLHKDSKTDASEFDSARMARMIGWRAFFHAPVAHAWFNFLERRIPGTAPLVVFKKVVLDQVIASPLVHLCFFPYMVMTEGGSAQDAYARFERNFITMGISYCVWPFVHAITFGIMPLRHRVAWVNVAALFWSGTLSALNQLDRSQ